MSDNFFAAVYRFFYNKVVGVVIILALALVSLAGTMIMQAPDSAKRDPVVYEQFLQAARQKYGGWTPVLDFLGFFQLWTSFIFVGLIILLALSIIACTTHRLPEVIQKAHRPRLKVSERFYNKAHYRAAIPTQLSISKAQAVAEKALKAKRYRIVNADNASDVHSTGALTQADTPSHTPCSEINLYADKFRLGPWGTVIAHTSFIIILIAFVISSFTGFDATLNVPVGDSVPVEHGTELVLHADSFTDSYDTEGRPLDYVSHLRVTRNGKTVGEEDVRVNTPLIVDNVRFHQASFGVAADITVMKDGKEVFAGVIPLASTTRDGFNAIGTVELRDEDLLVTVVTPASGQVSPDVPAGSAIIELYQLSTDEPLANAMIDQGKSEELDTVTVTFNRENQFTGIIVRRDPGAIWMWIGSTLLVIGTLMTFAMRPRRIWVRISQEGGIQLASSDKLDTIFERQFREIAEDIAGQVAPSLQDADVDDLPAQTESKV